jgi:hypothetical protein
MSLKGTTMHCSALEAHKTYSDKMSDGHYATYSANHPYLELNASNFNPDTFLALTGEIVEMTGDIALTSNYAKDKNGKFSGVLEGNGHKITGLKLQFNALFGELQSATIRNLVIVDAELIGYNNNAVLAYASTGGASYIDNIYISVKSSPSGSSAEPPAVLIPCSFSDVVVNNSVVYYYGENQNIGFVKANYGGNTIYVNNCVFIGTIDYYGYASHAGTVTPDANTGIYTVDQVNADVLAKMSTQNNSAYTANIA